VIHTACPTSLRIGGDPFEEIITPAVNGTLNVLHSCKKSGKVKTLVITSAFVACHPYRIENETPDKLYTDQDWCTDASETSGPYNYAKVTAEQMAWKFVEELPPSQQFRLVTICPGMVIGKQHTKNYLNLSNGSMMDLVDGKYPVLPRICISGVHARDVGEAHVNAMEREHANGRYILVSETLWFNDLAKKMSKQYPNLPIPTRNMPDIIMYCSPLFEKRITKDWIHNNLGRYIQADNERTRNDLGINFRSLEKATGEAIESFLELGLIKESRLPTTQVILAAGIVAVGVIMYNFTNVYINFN